MLLNELVLFSPGRIRIIHLTKTNKQKNQQTFGRNWVVCLQKRRKVHQTFLPFPVMEQKIYFCLFLNIISYLCLREKLILIFLMTWVHELRRGGVFVFAWLWLAINMIWLPVYTDKMQFSPRTTMQFTAPLPFFLYLSPHISRRAECLTGISITISTH